VVIWKACRSWARLCPRGRDPDRLGDVAVSRLVGAHSEGPGSWQGRDPAEPEGQRSSRVQGAGILVEHGSGHLTWSWRLAGPKG
jgi:hypothetical protein